MTETVVVTLAELARENISVEVCYTGGNAREFAEWLGPAWSYREQSEGDLGARMSSAIQVAFADRSDRVIVLGSDVPSLTPDIIRVAFSRLDSHDVVLGPTADGGYYLIGMSRYLPEVLESIRWGTPEVFEATVMIAERMRLSLGTLPILPDIDLPEDLDLVRDLIDS
jgi:rSAM/selenodomain-associated transferase 1